MFKHYRVVSRTFFAILLYTLAIGSAKASIFDSLKPSNDGPLPVEQAYIFSVDEVGNGQYQLYWQMPDDYYLYRDKIKLSLPPGVVLVEQKFPPSKAKDDPLFGQVQVYYQQVIVDITLAKTADVLENNTVGIEYQGCWEGGICYPPVQKDFTVTNLPDPTSVASVQLSNVQSSNKLTSADYSSGLSLTDQNQVAAVLNGASFPVIILLFFIAGLALSLTPCVFPMIPILASVIAGQQNMSAGRGFLLSVVYVLAMAITYTVAGVLAGLFGGNIQAAFQTPWIIILFSGMFVVFAGAMFGFYRMEMPHSLQNKLNLMCRSQQGGNVVGVAIMGLLSALIVGPCVAAPLAGALIFIGQTGDPYLGGSALFSLSMGMGAPLILVGTSAAKFLPQAGGWMNAVKQAFGVVMLLMAVWMLDRILSAPIILALTGVILVVTAVFMNATDRLNRKASVITRLSKGVGIILLVYGVALLLGAFAGGQSVTSPLKAIAATNPSQQISSKSQFTVVTTIAEADELISSAAIAAKPVVLDFYADWCVSCQELEHEVLGNPAVQQAMDGFTKIKVDLTANDDDAKAFYKKYSVYGPPALVFYDNTGEEKEDKLLVGIPTAEQFIKHIEAL